MLCICPGLKAQIVVSFFLKLKKAIKHGHLCRQFFAHCIVFILQEYSAILLCRPNYLLLMFVNDEIFFRIWRPGRKHDTPDQNQDMRQELIPPSLYYIVNQTINISTCHTYERCIQSRYCSGRP